MRRGDLFVLSWEEEVDAAGHRLAELSDMLSKGELPVVADNQENREEIAEHSFSVNVDVDLPGSFCTVLAEENRLAVGFVKGQSCLSRPYYHFIFFWL